MNIIQEKQLDFSDVLIRPNRSVLSSRSEVELKRQIKGLHNKEIVLEGIPIFMSNMTGITTWQACTEMLKNGMFVAMDKFKENSEWFEYLDRHITDDKASRLFYTIGIGDDDFKKFRDFKRSFPTWTNVVVDVANGYMETFANFIRKMRGEFDDLFIVAGNVVSAEMTQELILAGADACKCGIGSGQQCMTRKVTGVGRPQLSTIIECANAAHGLGGYIISDGGAVVYGDLSKALCAGADFVMIGSMLAGHLETGGELIIEYEKTGKYTDEECTQEIIEKRMYKTFWGMSSEKAQVEQYGEVKQHRASEGRVTKIPFRGSINNTLREIKGALSSTGTYIGARKIKDFPKCATFYLVNNQLSNPYENIGK